MSTVVTIWAGVAARGGVGAAGSGVGAGRRGRGRSRDHAPRVLARACGPGHRRRRSVRLATGRRGPAGVGDRALARAGGPGGSAGVAGGCAAMRDRELMVSGAVLTAGGAAVLIAAFLPSLYPVWTARAVNAVGIIAQHRGTWRLANVLFAAGAGLTLAGLAALTGRLNARPAATGILPTVALTLMALASALWLANLAFRLTVTMRVAGAVANGGTVPDWDGDVNAWTGGLWSLAPLAGAPATACFSPAVTGGTRGTRPGGAARAP